MIKGFVNSSIVLLLVTLFSCIEDFPRIPPNTMLINDASTSLKMAVAFVDDKPSTPRKPTSTLFFHTIMLLSNGFTINSQNVLGKGNGLVVTIASDKQNIKSGTYSFNPQSGEPASLDLLQAVVLDNYDLGVEKGNKRMTLTEGSLKISKAGEHYEIEFTGVIDEEEITVQYVGAVDVIDTAPQEGCRIHQITFLLDDFGDSYVTTYSYDANGKLSGSSGATINTYNYVNDFVRTKIIEYVNYDKETWSYENDLLSKISCERYFNGENVENHWYTYSYIGNTLMGYSWKSDEVLMPPYTVEYVYHGDNIASQTTTYPEDLKTLSFASYDFKKNPYLLLANAIGQSFFVGMPSFLLEDYDPKLSKNNPTKCVSSKGNVDIYTYEYNELGYPTRITAEWETWGLVSYIFTYEGCE